MAEAIDMKEEDKQKEDYENPVVTPKHVDQVIDKVAFSHFKGTTMTACCLTLKNGFTVLGKSNPLHLKGFSKKKGEEAAFQDAASKVYELEGYLIKQVMSFEQNTQH